MHSWIGWVIELLQEIGPRDFSLKLLRQGNGTRHSLCSIGELQLGSVGPEHGSPLGAHRVRHGEDQPVPTGCSHHRQSDSGVAAGGLHEHRSPRLNRSLGLSLQHHGTGDPVFHRRRGIEAFELGHHLSATTVLHWQPVEPHTRRASD